MPDLILHHYWMSPYSEKIRRIFGFKSLAWKSVEIPVVMPKPDLIALTGGYRKTPVLQIGADVYCDTECIARKLEELAPKPTLLPEPVGRLAPLLHGWAQELFTVAIQHVGATGAFPEGFLEDRDTMFVGGLDLGRMARELPSRGDQLRAKLALLEELFADGRDYLLGGEPTLADFSVFHPLFALRSIDATAPRLESYPAVRSWLDRLDAIGHGERSDIESSEAIEIARSAEPETASALDPGDVNGRKPGDRIEVVHEDFGLDPVVGELVASSAHEIAVRRSDSRVGDVVVHFPRQYYFVNPA